MWMASKRPIRATTCLYVALLAAASLLPSGHGVLGGWDQSITPTMQNAMHVPAYAVLTVLAVASFCHPASPVSLLAGLAAAATGYGVLLEWAQAAIPGRTASLADTLLNAAGAGAGLLACVIAAHALRSRRAAAPGR